VSKKLPLEIEISWQRDLLNYRLELNVISTISDKTGLTLVKYGASDRLVIALRFKMTVRVDFPFFKNEYGGKGLQESRERGR
jgi:hypothetical protein